MNTSAVASMLGDWLKPTPAWGWLETALIETAKGDRQAFHLAFAMAPRRFGKADLSLAPAEQAKAHRARPGWDVGHWSIDQAARTLLLLSWPAESPDRYREGLDQLFITGEVNELVALYQALPLLPFPESHRWRASEGVRTNMKTVLQAVAHCNPYPAEYFEEAPWNQMVLKCLFVGLRLDPIVGLDGRNNPRLSRMLLDYAHERWAAKRPVSPELWRLVSNDLDDGALADLRLVLSSGEPLQMKAAVLCLRASRHPAAGDLLAGHAELNREAAAGLFDWSSLSRTH